MRGKLLIVDDDFNFGNMLKSHFADKYAVSFFSDPEDAVRHIRESHVDVVLTDLLMPKLDGMEVLKIVKSESVNTDVILMTAYASIDTSVEAMRKGAYDYIIKPFELDDVSLRIENVFEKRRMFEENINLKQIIDAKSLRGDIIGENEAMKEVYRFIERVALNDVKVLITGESGTGKGLLAKAIHLASRRKDGKFVSINCSDIPEALLESELFGHLKGSFSGANRDKTGLFEYADGGTVLLDEIGDISMDMQTKLLRVMQDLKFRPIGGNEEIAADVRLICATNKDLRALIKENRFREDLFYRINVVSIHMPPLRERKEDIPLLISHFLNSRKKIHPKAISMLAGHHWPGNVRELKNTIERLVTLIDSDTIRPEDLPADVLEFPFIFEENGLSYNELKKKVIDEFNRAIINKSLSKNNGSATMAAQELGLARENFHRLIRKYEISTREFK